MLKFAPGTYREDVCALFKGITPNLLAPLEISQSKRDTPTTPLALLQSLLAEEPKPASIINAVSVVRAKCRKMRQEADDFRHNTGQHSLFIGYPLIYSPNDTGKFLLAPLFLWPINVFVVGENIRLMRLLDEDGEALEPRFNRIFQAWLRQETNVQLNWDTNEIEIHFNNVEQISKRILQPWTQCRKQFTAAHLDPLNDKKVFEQWVLEKREPCLLESAVVGHGSFKGQALLDDLDHLEKAVQENPDNCGVLKYFLYPRDTHTDTSAPEPVENAKWIVVDSDSSQETALWQSRESALTILQGPPGTGKSQTIVNLIADALRMRKTVAVVCQKRAALDVVEKRLRGAGLGDLLVLIDDPAKDRPGLIKRIREIERDFDQVPPTDSYRDSITRQITNSENRIDKYTIALNDMCNGLRPRFADLLAEKATLQSGGYNGHGNLRQFYINTRKFLQMEGREDLNNKLNELTDFATYYLRCSYKQNPWQGIKRDMILPTDASMLETWLSEMIHIAVELESDSNRRVHPAKLDWIAEHSLSSRAYLSVLPEQFRNGEQLFCQLAVQTRQLADWLPTKQVESILDEIRQGAAITAIYREYQKNIGSLSDVCFVNQKLKDRVLQFFVDMFGERVDDWPSILRAAVNQLWLDELQEKHKEALANTLDIENQRKQLKSELHRKRNIDKLCIKGIFGSRVRPRNELESRNLLRLRGGRGISRTSIRRLYHNGFDEINCIHPVLLTNPETASSVLKLNAGLYDLVIIDEASQVFMADAMPMLFRAKAAVISGDSNQMPPSDFFVSTDVDSETDDGSAEEEEIIDPDNNRLIAADGEYRLLDAAEHAVPAGGPNKKRLLVHYRSDFKELIDFSNVAFYDGQLIAPEGNKRLLPFLTSPIVLDEVSGTFKEGINEREAHEVVHKLKQIWELEDSPTVGIIAFNVRQRDRIEDVLIDHCQQDDQFRERLETERNRLTDDGEDAGLFVRAIEHVQGDERDIIIFSTTYDGRKHRNFGPISKREKGRRRLNVAVTRARAGLILISSLNIDHISNENERDTSENFYLWKYMCYARAIHQGNRAAANEILQSFRNRADLSSNIGVLPDSPFETDVADFLEGEGFHVDYQIGESGFRIDLGVKRNKSDRRYFCGIECDGRTYHRGWRARLNDIWRQEILERKGWKIVRIWSSDWYSNSQQVRADLVRRILATASVQSGAQV